jgi:5-methylcytosine-specific restriction enzyme subunit McrC
MTTVALTEWEEATPETIPALKDASLPPDTSSRALLGRLHKRGMITVRELRTGLAIATTSFVGSIQIGSITAQIRPKMEGHAFSVLLGYALGLPHLELLPEHQIALSPPAFQDLLADRLTTEATQLMSRGLYRHYVNREGTLNAPRGRILFSQLARSGPVTSAVLPCRFVERDENIWANRVLLAGLRLGARVALDPAIRARARRAAAMLAGSVQTVALTPSTFRALKRSASRLTAAYEPAFALIQLLMAGCGISATHHGESLGLPGFLFDMNLLFQESVGRFLHEWLADATVAEQYRLTDIFAYQPLFNPRRKRAPTPRPDYVMSRGGRIVAIADAKYRDLWERDLPSGMLYQLSVYALSQTECAEATILYPAATTTPRESRIVINDPVSGSMRAQISVRPVNLPLFAALIMSARTALNDRQRRQYAAHLALARPFSLSQCRIRS